MAVINSWWTLYHPVVASFFKTVDAINSDKPIGC